MDNERIWDGAIESYRSSFVKELEVSLQETAIHINLADCLNEACSDAFIHQEKHVKDMRLNQRSLDIYKALSWITWFMASNCKLGGENLMRIAARAGINELNETLLKEEFCDNQLPYRSRELMEAYIANEINALSDHGIALNGLFMAFHSVRETLKH